MKLNELEIKIQIGSEEHFHAIYESCNKLFGAPISHVLQLDEYYDTPDGQLKKQDLVIRIRSNGEKKTIALKSPRIELPSGMTNRIELEFLSAEGEQVHERKFSKSHGKWTKWNFMDNPAVIQTAALTRLTQGVALGCCSLSPSGYSEACLPSARRAGTATAQGNALG